MWDEILFLIQMRRLQRRKRKLSLELDKAVDKARRFKKTYEDIECIIRDYRVSLDLIEDEIKDLQHRYTVSLADYYIIPIPPVSDEDWVESPINGRYRLSDASLFKLRSTVRSERKERREAWLWMISALTGLGGVTVGILSLLYKK